MAAKPTKWPILRNVRISEHRTISRYPDIWVLIQIRLISRTRPRKIFPEGPLLLADPIFRDDPFECEREDSNLCGPTTLSTPYQREGIHSLTTSLDRLLSSVDDNCSKALRTSPSLYPALLTIPNGSPSSLRHDPFRQDDENREQSSLSPRRDTDDFRDKHEDNPDYAQECADSLPVQNLVLPGCVDNTPYPTQPYKIYSTTVNGLCLHFSRTDPEEDCVYIGHIVWSSSIIIAN